MIAKSNRYILRRENNSTRGWEVRIRRTKGNVLELFSDSMYGGKNKALQKAKKFRDLVLKKIPKLNRKEIVNLPKKNNLEEGVGISLVRQKSVRNNKSYTHLFYQAYWSPAKGVHKSRKFSISKYGKQLAYKLAAVARKKGLREMSL
ncbi:MAG: AP2 domain-containing protein [Bacteroidota bacterium]|nr:AP2 domain-containing protein [Bacteroidota bacterium]